ncbi:MAG: 50S ribosomal protein L23 [Parcubacteria group bacterium Gr01-1014_8]|nr:MAG: 50S ribosomal protein L23 [Parcubacteria group bacterium Gr01-1014_8]
MNALFSRKPKTEPKADVLSVAAPASQITRRSESKSNTDLSHILMRPRITEKATAAALMSVYVFDVASRATKREISEAVLKYYKVQPRMVRVVSVPEKKVRNSRTGARGTKQGGKKAYVYLTKGETITIA